MTYYAASIAFLDGGKVAELDMVEIGCDVVQRVDIIDASVLVESVAGCAVSV